MTRVVPQTSAAQTPQSRARGSVLPVVLILQGTLLLLALGATQSSLLELTMGGNELYRLRALTAANSAVAAGLAVLATAAAAAVPAARAGVVIAGMPGDDYDFTVRDGGDDARLLQLSGGTRVGHHYTIAATGRSLRGAEAHVDFGVRIVRDAAGTLLAVEREYWLRRDID
jgi:hypothetical protein